MPPSGFSFGPWSCKWSEAFYLTDLSMAIVSQTPIVPGHCLVLSRRVTPRFADLTQPEVCDLWKTAHHISTPLQTQFNAHALTFAIQDGPVAGQTVPHVHVHIIPRTPADFVPNDRVYDHLDNTDMSRALKVDAEHQRQTRTLQQMSAEAKILRTLFQSPLPIPDDY